MGLETITVCAICKRTSCNGDEYVVDALNEHVCQSNSALMNVVGAKDLKVYVVKEHSYPVCGDSIKFISTVTKVEDVT